MVYLESQKPWPLPWHIGEKAMANPVKITIQPPNFKAITLRVEGTAPLLVHKFSEKSRRQMEEAQTSSDKTKKKRAPKDYVAEFKAAKYISTAKWEGIPAAAFRMAMINSCRMLDGLPMTKARGAFFIKAQGREKEDGTSLIKIIGKAQHDTRPVRLESGVADLRNRPRYDDWACELTIEYDADILSASDVANLLARAGAQVGICELRPQGKKSHGGDFGTFSVTTPKKKRSKVA